MPHRPKRTFRRFPVLPRTRRNPDAAIGLTIFGRPESHFSSAGTGREPGLSRSATEARAIPNRNQRDRLLSLKLSGIEQARLRAARRGDSQVPPPPIVEAAP